MSYCAATTPIALVFLARGRHDRWKDACQRFVESYLAFPAGADHRLYVVFKGYDDDRQLGEAEACFTRLTYTPLRTGDDAFDIGTYKRVARIVPEERICFLNTKTEFLTPGWLGNLVGHLALPGVGLVGATGSYVSHEPSLPAFPRFPNPHIRTNAFLLDRRLFCEIADGFDIRTKYDGWMFESGPKSLTRQIIHRGMRTLVVGRDGMAYDPSAWPASRTYRSGSNANALIADDLYRQCARLPPEEREKDTRDTWGAYLDPGRAVELAKMVRQFAETRPFNRQVRLGRGQPLRNDPCPCGSGIRYKRCHGLLRPAAREFIEGTRRLPI